MELELRKFWTWVRSHLTKTRCQVIFFLFRGVLNFLLSPLKKYPLSLIGFTLLNSYCIGDKSALVPGGIRIGMPAMTTRGFKEKDFLAAADLIHEGVQMALEVKRSVSGTKLKDFMEYVESPEFLLKGRISDLKRRVEALATQFPLPGV